MKCPTCGNELTQVIAGEIVADVCKNGCGGIWFDHYEFEKIDEKHEAEGEPLLHIERNPSVKVIHGEKRKCPCCSDIVMMQHFFSVKEQVELDECPKCGGIWLDAGELANIRKLFDTEEDRKKAANELFDKLFGKQLEEIKEKSHEKVKRSRKIAKVLKFLCPSYYIPGDQDWGAY